MDDTYDAVYTFLRWKVGVQIKKEIFVQTMIQRYIENNKSIFAPRIANQRFRPGFTTKNQDHFHKKYLFSESDLATPPDREQEKSDLTTSATIEYDGRDVYITEH